MAKLKDGSQVYGNLIVDTNLLVSTDATILGNLNVSGTVTTVNSTTIQVVDPIARYGGGANGAALTSNDGKDRGIDLSYYSGSAKEAFMGWKTGSNTFILASNATIASNEVTVDTYGDLTMGKITADGGLLSNINGANVTGWVQNANYANYSGTVVNGTQSNITLLGTQTSLTVSGTSNVAGVNANGIVDVTNSTTSTSTTSGALKVAGGAGIVGDLWVGGTIHGAISGSTSAPGANTNVVFNDDGTSNATGGLTFAKDTNTLSTTNLVLSAAANVGSNINLTGSSSYIKGTNTFVEGSTTAKLSGGTSNITTNSSSITLETSSSNVTLDANLTLNSGALILPNANVRANGDINAKAATFTSVTDSGLTSTRLVVAGTGGLLGDDANLTWASGKLTAGNIETTDAKVNGSLTLDTGIHDVGNLLSTDINGNVVDTQLVSTGGNLTIPNNLSVTHDANVNTLHIASLSQDRVTFVGASGNITSSSSLTFDGNVLAAGNIEVTGNIVSNTVTSNNLVDTQIVFSGASKNLTSSAGLTFASDTLSANNITSSGHIRGNTLQADNISATKVVYANTSGNLVGDSSFTYTSGTSTLAANNVVASSSLTGAKVSANNISDTQVPFANIDHTLVGASSFTYNTGTSTLSANNVSVSVDITSGNVWANSGTVKATTLTGTLSTAAQTNITSVGTLTDLSVTGNVTAGGVKTDNLYYANGTAWDLQQAGGSNTQIQFNNNDQFGASANLTFDSSTSTLTVTGTAVATTGNITEVNSTNANVTGTLVAATGNITTINAGNIGASGNLTVSGWANITGNLRAGDTVVTGNLTVTGTTTSVNTTVTQLTDPLFELGGGANGAALATNDAYDRGLLMHTRTGGVNKDLFMGWDNSATQFVLAKNVTVSDNVVTVPGTTSAEIQANLADLKLANIYAYNANFGGVVFSEGNITLGSGSFVNGNVNGNISGTITVTGGSGAIQFANVDNALVSSGDLNFNDSTNTLNIGQGGGTVVANVITANYVAGTLTTATQPNITSVGTLTSLSVSGNISGFGSGNGILTDNLFYANGQPWDLQQASGSNNYIQYNIDGNFSSSSKFTFDPTSNVLAVDGNISSANYVSANYFTGTLTTASQPNITSLGTLNNTTLGSANSLTGGNLVSATYISGDGSLLTNITSGNITGQVANALIAGTVYTNAQPNITSVGTLTSLTVHATGGAGNITADNVNGGNLVTANYFTGNGSLLTSITGANVTGYVPNADTANVAYAVSAGNITGTTLASGVVTSSLTTVGTLGSLTVTNDITSTTGKVLAGQIGNASSYLYGDGSNISGVTASSIAAANLTGSTLSSNVTSSSLTSLGTLTALTVNGTTNLGPISNVTISGGTSGQYLQTNGSGTLSWSTVELSNIHNGTSNVNIASSGGNVTVAVSGSEIISIATTGLTVTGVISATGNITANNLTSNNYIVANNSTAATSAVTGAITTPGGISAVGNVYTGNVVGFAHGSGNTDSAAYIKYNATSGSLDFIFN